MANAEWEEFEAQHRFDDEYEDAEREEARREAAADVVHSRPDYDFRTDKTSFPCGLPGGAPVRVSWGGDEDITCAECVAALALRRLKIAVSSKRNAEWLAAQPRQPLRLATDGVLVADRFRVVDGAPIENRGEGANGSPADDLALKVTE